MILLRYLALYVSLTVIAMGKWLDRKFQDFEFEQILFHIQLSEDQVLQTDYSLVENFLKNTLGAALLVLLLLAAAFWVAERRSGVWATVLVRARAYLMSWLGLSAVFLSGAAYFALLNVKLPDGRVEDKDWLAELYVKPELVQRPAKKKNLVLIYGESFEKSLDAIYPNDKLFQPVSFDHLPHVSVPRFKQAFGASWTIAGIMGSQCGLPLKPVGMLNRNRIGENTHKFLPGADCLPDILAEDGYHNIFIGGAYTEFSGKSRYLKQHGYGEIHGRVEFLDRNPKLPLNNWGVQDDDLFKFAKQRYLQLKREHKPFNLTMLTLGMHIPEGFPAPSCPRKFNDYRDSIYCTSYLVRDFVDFVAQNDPEGDVKVVVMGDHLTMRPYPKAKPEWEASRSIFNALLAKSDLPTLNKQEIVHFDMYPTLLEFMGYEVKGGRAGMGCSAIGASRCDSLAADPLLDAKLQRHSDFYYTLWTQDD